MKKFLFGILLVGVIAGVIYLCSDSDDDYQSVRELLTCQEKVITWNKLDTVVIGDGLLKFEYPDCFELGDSICGDSDVIVSYKDDADLFLIASVTANEMHLNTDELAEYIVNLINEEGNDTVTMQDMHDGYFYLTCAPKRTRYRSYEQYVVDHDLIYKLCLMYSSHFESKTRKLKEYVHGWNPKTKKAIWSGPWEEPRERMSVLKKKVGEHNYREFCIEQGENGYHFMVYDSCHHNCQEVVFDADDYMNEGVPSMYAFVSPDQQYIYVVGDIMANGIGRLSTFLVYQVNTETLRVRFVHDGAGVRLEKNGFSVASKTRCVTPDAEYTYQMDFNFEDITYGFNGKIKRRSKEYSSKMFRKRYGESLNNLRGLGIMRGQYDE